MKNTVTNITVAGLGGQGVLLTTDVLAEAAFLAGFDVKKSEVHGMSQRGGSVSSEVRFGSKVASPMIPSGESDFLLVLETTQIELNKPQLKDGGLLLTIDEIDTAKLSNAKSSNIAMLGKLSTHLEIPVECWIQALRNTLPAKIFEVNFESFNKGREGQV